MGGTKIFVFKLRTIITAGAAVLIAIAVLAAGLALLLPGKSEGGGAAYKPGTYSATIILHNKPVAVDVTLSKDEIVAVELKEMSVAQQLAYPLFQPTMNELSREIIRRQTTDITLASDTQVTSRILLNAVDAAIAQGAK